MSDTQDLFHQQTLHTVDDESLNIDFPLSAHGLMAGPTIGSGIIGGTASGTGAANVLPFGPVNLAFPDISQTVNQAYAATETGFYDANFLGIPPVNTGAAPVTAGPIMPINPVTPPARIAGPYMPFPEMVDTSPVTDRTKALGETSNSSMNNTKSLKSIRLNSV